jgi:hypothetical protein
VDVEVKILLHGGDAVHSRFSVGRTEDGFLIVGER